MAWKDFALKTSDNQIEIPNNWTGTGLGTHILHTIR